MPLALMVVPLLPLVPLPALVPHPRWCRTPAGAIARAALKREGIDCDLAHLNFDLAEIVGREAYAWINKARHASGFPAAARR